MGKKVLIVFAHNEKKSYNGVILQKTEETLKRLGHEVVVSDLYQMGFTAVLSENDFKGPPSDDKHFNWAKEMAIAHSEGRLADDIQAEQQKVAEADLVIFQFPMYWMGFPAIMKGWMDRVMTSGFAFDIPNNIFDKAYLRSKKTLLSFTAGGSSANYSHSGPWGDMDVNLWPLHCGCLYFMGFEVLAPNIVYGCDPGALQDYDPLGRWLTRLETIFNEKPLKFLGQDDYQPMNPENPALGVRLMKSVTEKSEAVGLTTGQHLGLPLPEGNQTQIPK